jgi:hypothetical protein
MRAAPTHGKAGSMPFFYVALMSTRFFQSARLDELRDALSETAERPARGQPPLDKG